MILARRAGRFGRGAEFPPGGSNARRTACKTAPVSAGPWPEPCDLKPVVGQTVQKEDTVWNPSPEVEPNDRVPAYVLVPDGVVLSHPVCGRVASTQRRIT